MVTSQYSHTCSSVYTNEADLVEIRTHDRLFVAFTNRVKPEIFSHIGDTRKGIRFHADCLQHLTTEWKFSHGGGTRKGINDGLLGAANL